ncbi:MAG: alpha-glucosidase C-terminal domain-containing protein, partial [Cyanobacteria bacterium HKST-UBA06]|nr:alpha-glucosidase C-terminal domain-containing protein [Cyanobacteria bacterium HKST-UBA06]
GDNIYLGDRNAVRTPMQWSIDRNGGFSMADPARLYHPVIMDPVYGYQSVNVEAQMKNQSSLFHFMKQIIGLRRQYKAFGRGSLTFLHPENHRILAYLRRYKHEVLLCVVNLCDTIQPVNLDLSEYAGSTPLEMFGRTEFPTIGQTPYFLSLPPHGFYWFKIVPQAKPIGALDMGASLEKTLPRVVIESGRDSIWEMANKNILEKDAFPRFLPNQHWFIPTGQKISQTHITDWVKISANFWITFVNVSFEDGSEARYCLPLRIALDKDAERILEQVPKAVVCLVNIRQEISGVLYDAFFDEVACNIFYSAIEDSRHFVTDQEAAVRGFSVNRDMLGTPETDTAHPAVRHVTLKQRNTSLIFGTSAVLKLFRKVEPGVNPDIELREYLLHQTNFRAFPIVTGGLSYTEAEKKPAHIAMLQRYAQNDGDCAAFIEAHIQHFFKKLLAMPAKQLKAAPVHQPDTPLTDVVNNPIPQEALALMDDELIRVIEAIGKTTADFHAALSQPTRDKAFSPQLVEPGYLDKLSEVFTREVQDTLEILIRDFNQFDESLHGDIDFILSNCSGLVERFDHLHQLNVCGYLIRCHGNYKLHNMIRCGDDQIYILDFDGDLYFPLEVRRQKHPAIKDVADLLFSIATLGHTALANLRASHPDKVEDVRPWCR